MRKAVFIFLTTFCFLTTLAQSNIDCETNTNSQLKNNLTVIGCEHTSDYYSDNTLYFPKSNDENIQIIINFIFLTKPDGTGNFEQDNEEHIEIIDEIIELFKWRLNSLIDTEHIVGNCYSQIDLNDEFISDTKVEVIVNKIWKVDSAWDYLETGFNSFPSDLYILSPSSSSYYYSYYDDYELNNIPKGINVVFANNGDIYEDLGVNEMYEEYQDGITNHGGQDWAISQFPTTYDLNRPLRQFYPDVFNKFLWMKHVATETTNQPWDVVRPWFTSIGYKTMPHELGHNFGLTHQNSCDVNIMNQNWSSQHQFLKPRQIGKMHRSSAITNLRQYFTETSYTNNFREVESDTWDLDMRLYSDVKISGSNVILETCKLILPPQSKIIIQDNSKFILDGGEIKSANDESWRGVEIYNHGSFEILPGTIVDTPYFLVKSIYSSSRESKNYNTDFSVIKDSSLNNNLLVYPNPFNDIINIVSNEAIDRLVIIDSYGSVIYDRDNIPKHYTIDTKLLKRGLYYVNIFINGKKISTTVIKNN